MICLARGGIEFHIDGATKLNKCLMTDACADARNIVGDGVHWRLGAECS